MKITIEFDSYKELLEFKNSKNTLSFNNLSFEKSDDEFKIDKPSITTLDELIPPSVADADRIKKCLHSHAIDSVSKLVIHSHSDLLRMPNISRGFLITVITELSRHGLKLKD